MKRIVAGLILGLVLGFLFGHFSARPVEAAPKQCVGNGARACRTPTPVLTQTVTATATATVTQTATPTPTPTVTPTASPAPTAAPTPTLTPTATPTPTPSGMLQCGTTDWSLVYPVVPPQGQSRWCDGTREFTVTVIDATSSGNWHALIAQSAADWSASAVLNIDLVVGPADPTCTRPGGDGLTHLVKVCDFTDDSFSDPSDGHCNSIGCTEMWIMPPECCTPTAVYIRDGVVWLNNWWIDPQRYRLDMAADYEVLQTIVCHELGHTFPLEHYDPITYSDWQSCVFNHGPLPAQSLQTLEEIYP